MATKIDPSQYEDPAVMATVTKYTQIYPQNLDEAKTIYRKLRSVWHPDTTKCSDKTLAARIFTTITNLYGEFESKMADGTYGYGKKINFSIKKSEFTYHYFGEDEVNVFGTQYVGRNTIAFDFSDAIHPYLPLWQTAFNNMRSLAGTYNKFAESFHHQLAAAPQVHAVNDDSGYVIEVAKTAEHLCLAHILRAGPLSERHVAWIISRLLSLGRFCVEANVVNLDICTRNIFIHPAEHSLFVADGWQYANGFKSPAKAAPESFIRMFPDFADNPHPSPKHLIGMIKKVGKTALGDSVGVRLAAEKKVPAPMIKWLNTALTKASFEMEMKNWEAAKVASFGPPKFVDLYLTEKGVYS